MRALVLTGVPGAGKTTVAVELGHLLESHGHRTAVVDADYLCWVGPDVDDAELRDLLAGNLADVSRRYAEANVDLLVVARALASQADAAAVRAALAPIAVTVIRLELADDIAATRRAGRDVGAEAAAMAVIADRLTAAVRRVDVDGVVDAAASPADVAAVVAVRAGLL